MLQMIFARSADGSVAPRLPRERDGSPKVPDGVATFSLAQAAAKFQMPEPALVARYDEVYGDLFPRLQDGEKGEVEASAAAAFKKDILRAVRFNNLNDEEFAATMDFCRSRGLDPWRHVVALPKIVQGGRRELGWIITIDALRSLADATGKYEGQTLPQFLDEDGAWHKGVWSDKVRPPVAAKVGIRRKGFAKPQWAIAEWACYVQTVDTPRGPEISDFWTRMGAPQLAKCAESLALRKSFPKALGGLYTHEEMAQAENSVERKAAQAKPIVDEEVIIDDSTPVSWREFDRVLEDRFGIASPEGRTEVTARLRRELGGGNAPVLKTFFARAIRAIERMPQAYGAVEVISA